ncbi:hypothetical protein YC2023_065631 [Brassica napus]
MKYFHGFLLLLITAYDILESVQAQNQSARNLYGEVHESDANYIDTGLVGRIRDEYKVLQQQTWTLRSFPEGTRNCYNFNLTAKRKYLISV